MKKRIVALAFLAAVLALVAATLWVRYCDRDPGTRPSAASPAR